MRTLYLRNNSIADISALAGLTQLTELYLDNNSISDIAALAGLTNLRTLYLRNNLISDISPLVTNTGLKHGDYVDVRGNPLSSLSLHTHIPTLQSRKVTVDALAAGSTIGEPYTVRLIYFLPNDRPPQPDIDIKMDALIKDVQQDYADRMETYGFGRKTFTFETDATGKAVVHHVSGKFNDAYYQDYSLEAWEETNLSFDISNNINLVALDISSEILKRELGRTAAGIAQPRGAAGGQVLMPASGRFFNTYLAYHELAHAFGLINHDYRNVPGARLVGGSACACEWLNVHPYFNTNRQSQNLNNNTRVEMSTPRLVSLPNVIHLRFEVSDPDGLHQAQLVGTRIVYTTWWQFRRLNRL